MAATRKKATRKKATRKKTTRKKTTRKKAAPRKKTTARKKTTSRKKTTGRKKTTRKKASTRKYSRKAGKKVETAVREMKAGKLRSGGSGKRVTSRKQAIAIGLSEARKEGDKVANPKDR
ncbi:MAG TPA: DUF6496 domain-containing protein [Candidatus Baltobacteraceae bacterium]|jgi:hypothetical protein